MIHLLAAIQTAFNASSDLSAAFPHGLEVSQAADADAEALPSAILTIVSDVPDYDTCTGAYVQVIQIDFTLRQRVQAAGGDFLLTAADALDAAFNRQDLTLTNDRLLNGQRKSSRGPYNEDQTVMRHDVSYVFWVQRNL